MASTPERIILASASTARAALLRAAGVDFTIEPAAFFNPSAKTVIVPKSGTTRFYRLRSSAGYTLGRPTVSGNNVVLSYQ